ncbi:MAG: site-specific tyrosine recombinase XerD [Alphaproteobacteria bacterium]|nr:site-specific tyrosine recombinase XerD [Alphaproteobacteria bacterium]
MNNELILAFAETITAERGAAANTVAAYTRDLKDFGSFLDSRRRTFENAEMKDLRAYMAFTAQKGMAEKTQARRLSALREFYKYLYTEKIRKDNPSESLDSPRLKRALPKYLSEEEINKLFEAVDQIQPKNKAVRMRTLLEILYASGLRVSELVTLPANVVNIKENFLIVRGKGAKDRMVPLTDAAKQALHDWIPEREKTLPKGRGSRWLFPSSSKTGHLSRESFFLELKELALKAGIPAERVSPHVIRHSFASHLVAHDADLRTVQQMLGHSDIATTQIYTHILDNRLKNSVEKSHPMADPTFFQQFLKK